MGAAASAASPPPEAADPADPPATEVVQPAAAAAADPPSKEDIQHGAAADPPSEAAAVPADSPAKKEIQSTAAAEAPGGDAEAAGETVVLDAAAAEAGEEEQAECGFCLFMKGGGCNEEFMEWEKCLEVAEAEGVDIVDRCAKATTALRTCMGKYPDYYEPILSAEQRMSEDLEAAVKAEAEGKASQASPASPPAPAAEGEQGDSKKHPEEKQPEDVVIVVDEKEDPAA